jgi:dTDP-4-amino-4,6-dideoxygalactose transaminase
MAAIQALSARYEFRIIEDASHAVGAKYQGNPVGNSQYSDITVFSFHPVKIVTTGEGGAALTNQEALASRMSLLRNHGITRDASQMTAASEGPWYYQQIDLGFNYRMTDIQAALGLSQLTRLEAFVARRHQIAERYDEALRDLLVVTPWQHPDGYSSLHLYVIRLKLDAIRRSHRTVFEALRASGIGVNLHYIPIYRQPYYIRRGFAAGSYPEAERYYAEAISLPIYPDLTDEQQDRVIGAVRKALTS